MPHHALQPRTRHRIVPAAGAALAGVIDCGRGVGVGRICVFSRRSGGQDVGDRCFLRCCGAGARCSNVGRCRLGVWQVGAEWRPYLWTPRDEANAAETERSTGAEAERTRTLEPCTGSGSSLSRGGSSWSCGRGVTWVGLARAQDTRGGSRERGMHAHARSPAGRCHRR